MAINYTWDVSTVDVKEIDGNADTVFNVHWRLTGTDDANDESASIKLLLSIWCEGLNSPAAISIDIE